MTNSFDSLTDTTNLLSVYATLEHMFASSLFAIYNVFHDSKKYPFFNQKPKELNMVKTHVKGVIKFGKCGGFNALITKFSDREICALKLYPSRHHRIPFIIFHFNTWFLCATS